MFCPKCKSEYRDGFYKCADCGVDFVEYVEKPEQLQNELPDKEFNFVELLATFNEADVVFVKSRLEGEGITYMLDGEYHGTTRRGNQPMRFFVADFQFEQAREMLKDFKEKFWAFDNSQS